MKAFASDKTARLGAEGLVLWAEIHNEGNVNVAVSKCHGGDHSKQSNFFTGARDGSINGPARSRIFKASSNKF